MTLGTRRGFSFLELIVGIVILMCGVVPLFWVMSGSTRGAKLTVQQVQATTHATNLMEVVRAAGYDLANRFPAISVQMKGGGSAWRHLDDGRPFKWAGPEDAAPTDDAKKAFDEFRQCFFDSKNPIVPPMEDYFERYLVIIDGSGSAPPPAASGPGAPAGGGSGGGSGKIGVVVRVEWTPNRPSATGEEKEKVGTQYVELRTVLGNPYRAGGASKGAPPK